MCHPLTLNTWGRSSLGFGPTKKTASNVPTIVSTNRRSPCALQRMDEILHLETVGNHCLLAFAGELNQSPRFLNGGAKWVSSIHHLLVPLKRAPKRWVSMFTHPDGVWSMFPVYGSFGSHTFPQHPGGSLIVLCLLGEPVILTMPHMQKGVSGHVRTKLAVKEVARALMIQTLCRI